MNKDKTHLKIFGYGFAIFIPFLMVMHALKDVYNPSLGQFCLWLIPSGVFILWILNGAVKKHGLFVFVYIAVLVGNAVYAKRHDLFTLGLVALSLLSLVFYGIAGKLPGKLQGLYDVWMKMAHGIAFVISNIVLTLLYIIAFVPAGLIMRLAGKDPLNRKIDKESASYWIFREDAFDKERCTKQF